MELTEERFIAAPREAVFAALNDPKVLAQAIPGCESLEQSAENQFSAVVQAKVGPVRAQFNGQVTLSDINPPESYTITGEGKGGAAGFAKGGATIRLAEENGGTRMTYVVKADVGGKLAQLGGRLIEGTSKKLAGEFFDAFEKLVTAVPADSAVAAAPEPAPAGTAASQPAPQGFMGGLWVPIAVAGFAALAYWLSTQKLIG